MGPSAAAALPLGSMAPSQTTRPAGRTNKRFPAISMLWSTDMNRLPWTLFSLLLAALVSLPSARADDDSFEPIFDGKTLENWDGNPKFWSVEDGAITGITTADNPTPGNTFIVWRGGEPGDFELKLEYKIVGGNSGIQYRSFEVPNEKWVVGGYQADFEAGETYSGINYGERFRGILAGRGQKTEVTRTDGGQVKVNVLETFADSGELQKKIKKEDWNSYHIIAKGFEFTHKINDTTMSICIDRDEKERREKGIIALQLHAGPPMHVQFRNIRIKKLDTKEGDEPKQGAREKKKVIFLAGGPSHGFGAHDHLSGCSLLAKQLERDMGYETVVHYKDWPQDLSAYEGADCVVMYSDGGGGHPVNRMLGVMDQVAKRGTGIVCIHYAVEVPKGESGEKFLDWIGGYFETNWSVNPHWVANFETLPEHPITRGVSPFKVDDEWYYHMRFRPKMEGVVPILTSMPPKETLNRGDGSHSGNPEVRKAVLERKEPQHVAWAAERENNGRGFGFTGGHNHWNWGDPNFRRIVLNAIVWSSHGEVPTGGVGSKPVTFEDLLENHDEDKPANLNADQIINRFNLKTSGGKPSDNGNKSGASGRRGSVKPVASTKLITPGTRGVAEEIEADIKGAKQLYLVVTDGGDGFSCDWANWAEPRLVGPSGEKKLTDLKWKSAQAGYGSVELNKNCTGKEMKINGMAVDYGIGTHATSLIVYDLPEGYETFKARGGLDDGGTTQGCGSTVQFLVYTQNPGPIVASVAGSGDVSREAEHAVDGLDVAEGLEATLFASEPDISNITSIDIDHRGRVWACEVKNYRKWAGSRPEGDRILVLEDTNGDGTSDKTTVFYQGRDIDSAHGVCVLGNRVLVSANDKVLVFFDDNGDLKADRKEVMFSGISGTQHDHGIHAVQFGPDGKLYFNFGNSGGQLKDKDGKPIVDLAGNEINSSRKPYQEGMVFRCDLDGSNVETLGWNFRNNWEVTVDSFGTMWQSDNDDDGNRGVRINYVMDFGNYGYKDELTGAGWTQQRTNWEKEIPERHWHLNDPGVVPTLLITGAGSPTGIIVYEGTLLPEIFHNQMIHCDAGPNVCRAYPVEKDGAGYKAEMVNILHGARDNWFRPSDVCVAPDGSLFVADWYDPGVGGHNQQEVDKGRIFRVAPPGSNYVVPKYDFSTVEGAIQAMKSPNLATRYMAFTALVDADREKVESLRSEFEKSKENPRLQARLVGVAVAWLAKRGENDKIANLLGTIAHDDNPDLRVWSIRLARQHIDDVVSFVRPLAADKAPEVRREVAIALRHSKDEDAAQIWAELAAQHDGKDRWYLEALGIGADKSWDRYLAAYLKKVGDKWNTPAGRDIVWRSRAKQTPELLAAILKDPAIKEDEQPRYFRAFDFLSGPEKEKALESLLE
jgi:putative membrane-bound dehydrogenase-like protein